MPKARPRNRRKRGLAKESETPPRDHNRVRLKKHKFLALKKNRDFVTLVKIGRVLNAIAFGVECIEDYKVHETPHQMRQYHRAFFITGGYLYEGLQLVGSVRSKYALEPSFAPLNKLLGDEYKYVRNILKEIRHSVAFHLDSDDKTTAETILSLDLPRYDFASGISRQFR